MTTPASRRLLGVATAVAGAVFTAAAVASLGVWLIYARLEGLNASASTALSAVFRFGATAMVVGSAILVFLYFSRNWPAAQPTVPGEMARPRITGWLIPFGVYLGVFPLLLVAASAPAVMFASAHRAFWNDSLASLLLMVPMFESVATAGLLMGSIALLSLFWSRSAVLPRAFVAWVGVQLGFVLMTSAAIDLVSVLADRFVTAVPMILEHDTAVRLVARNQTWLLVASAIWAALLFVSPRTAETFVPRLRKRVSAGGVELERECPQPSPTVALPAQRKAPRSPFLEQAPRYYLRAKYFAGFLGGVIQAEDLNGTGALSATIAPLTGHILVRSSGPRVAEVAAATRNRYLTPWPSYLVTEPSRQPIGGIKKVATGQWRILNRDKQEIGTIAETALSIGQAEYWAHVGDTPVCTLVWSNVLRPELVLDCAPDVDRLLDWRLALACALAVFVDVCPTG